MQEFLDYLKFNKKYSDYTILNYEIDLRKLEQYLKINQFKLIDLDYKRVNEFVIYLKNEELSTNSINRILSSSRTYFNFLERLGKVKINPFKMMSSLKKDKVLPNYFKYNDFIEMINSIDLSTPLGVRNRALLELLLATGARIGEVVNIKLKKYRFRFR